MSGAGGHRFLISLLVAGGLAACGEPQFCESEVAFDYAPAVTGELNAFPDDFFTEADSSAITGLKIQVAGHPWLEEIPAGFEETFLSLEALDGWGTTSGIILRFTGELGEAPSGLPASVASEAIHLVELGDEVRRIPFEVKRTDEERTLILWPMVPLKPATRHAVVVTDSMRTAAGTCISPSRQLREILTGKATGEGAKRMVPRIKEVIDRTGISIERVSAAVAFTTQSIVEESQTIALDIRERSYEWSERPVCETAGAQHRTCEGRFIAKDYRDADGVIRGTAPVGEYELKVRFWLPLEGDGALPVMLFGHGLTGSRHQAGQLADHAAPLGVVTVAIDALHHGEHPTASGGIADTMSFFGIGIGGVALQPLVLRDNWRQSTYDKLQLLELLTAERDVDGDGEPDLDTDRLSYLGASLGGIMGSELLAMTDRVGAAILSVPGGRVGSIISDAQEFSFIITFMKPQGTTDGDVDRFFPVLQALIERGDSANYAPFVLRNRLPHAPGRPPHLLFNMAIDDGVVPEVTNFALARALDLPQLAPAIREVGVIALETKGYPLSANLEDGTTTAGVFQYDRVRRRGRSEVEIATHNNLSASTEAVHQAMTFLTTWLDTGTAVIVNPFDELETPSL